MELTQEFFVNGFQNLEKNITERIEKKIDEKIEAQTKELKAYVHESFEAQQVFIEESFKEHKVPGLEARVTKVEMEVKGLKLHRQATN